ncbi:MAG: PVC-type heme-binding CxxCH protein [Pirellulales bacterium]
MRSTIACWAALALLLVAGRGWAGEIALNGHVFRLPDGFEIELAAGPPLADRPITAALDELGRLYVADSSGSNDKVQQQLEDRPHRIVRLEDADGDGRFDRQTVFADRMMFPEGTLWFDGSLYVAAPPSIWRLTDTDGDGVADHRGEWFQGKTLTGCANDLHGPYLGPDGRIYWCKGAFAEQTYDRPGRGPLVTRASHIFRCRPDGTDLEAVMTGGMDNPVDVVFTPGGERIFSTTFLVHPGGGLRDGLIHALYGGVYGKQHGVLDGHARTGELLPVLVHLGPAAPCGLERYESEAFGPEYRDNVFTCLFNLHKLTRHVLSAEGPGLAASSEDFLVSSNLDFHPTDVLEDADGSLLVCDTGGWYKLCCPTSQLGKPDVLGAIYRIRRKDAPKAADPRGLELAWDNDVSADELASRLADPRPAVRRRATEALAQRGTAAVEPLARFAAGSGLAADARRQAVWALTWIDAAEARAAIRPALADPDELVRQAALHSISLWKDRGAAPQLLEMLATGTPSNRRVAAEALGRIGDAAAVPHLLRAAAGELDRRLEHAIIYALIEIGAAEATQAGLTAADAATRRAALFALDQMEGEHLAAGTIVPLLASSDAPVKSAAEWIVQRHPEWGDAMVGYFRQRLADERLGEAEGTALEEQLVRFAGSESVQRLLAACLVEATFSDSARHTSLGAMGRAGVPATPAGWLEALSRLLDEAEGELLARAVAVARSLPPSKEPDARLAAALLRVARIESLDEEVRLSALAARPARVDVIDPDLFELVRRHLEAEAPVAVRTAAADAVAKAGLTGEQLRALCEVFETIGPLEAERVLSAYEQTTDPEVGRALADALGDSPALTALRPDAIKTRLEKFGPELEPRIAELLALLNVDIGKQTARLEELLATLSAGDARRGQAVFQGAKAACAACHAVGYVGGRSGPDLTRIGEIRNERDLLEAIVFPSASFVRSYEPVIVSTIGGKVHNGLVREETPEALVLATGVDQEVRVSRDEIEEIQPSAVSIMPSGLDQQLTPQDLADLIAFLKAAR